MIVRRPDAERGRTDFGWLDSRHTFSFGDYYDPAALGFGSLRVINDDIVAPGAGFGTHPHRDMEIVTWVLEGELAHRDSSGGGGVLRPGDAQHMTAGTGVLHSEINPSRAEPVRFLQIWIHPEAQGLAPHYEQRAFPAAERQGRLRLIASHDGRDGSLKVHQDVDLHATLLDPGERIVHRLLPGHRAWVQVATGAIRANGTALAQGDGAALTDEETLTLEAQDRAEVLLFDLGDRINLSKS